MLMNRSDRSEAQISVQPFPEAAATTPHMEEQLASIIKSARNVAVAAEELLRELSQSGLAAGQAPRAIAMAPRLLAATEQQLASVSAMLRQA
jgi:hypothetical protein